MAEWARSTSPCAPIRGPGPCGTKAQRLGCGVPTEHREGFGRRRSRPASGEANGFSKLA